jgi:hypothetical protein
LIDRLHRWLLLALDKIAVHRVYPWHGWRQMNPEPPAPVVVIASLTKPIQRLLLQEENLNARLHTLKRRTTVLVEWDRQLQAEKKSIQDRIDLKVKQKIQALESSSRTDPAPAHTRAEILSPWPDLHRFAPSQQACYFTEYSIVHFSMWLDFYVL